MKLARILTHALAFALAFASLLAPAQTAQTPVAAAGQPMVKDDVIVADPEWAPYLEGTFVQTPAPEAKKDEAKELLRQVSYMRAPFAKSQFTRASYPGTGINLDYCPLHADYAGREGMVRLLSRETGEPVSGATLHCFESKDLEAVAKFDVLLDADDLPAELKAGRATLSADDLGMAKLAKASSAQLVVAIAGDKVGFGVANWAHAFTQELTVHMAKPRSIIVRVTDLSGRAGDSVPVQLEVKSGGTWRTVHTRITGPGGWAKFGFANLIAQAKSANKKGAVECRVLVGDILGEQTTIDVNWADQGMTWIDVQVDLGVDVFADLVDPLGLALTRRDVANRTAFVEIPAFEYSERVRSNTRTFPLGRFPRGALWSMQTNGTYALGRDGLGNTFQVTDELVASEHVEIQASHRGVVLAGRLVDASGAGFSDRDISFRAETDMRSPGERLDFGSWPTLRTDKEGRFLLRMHRNQFRGNRGPDALSRLFFGSGVDEILGGGTADLTDRVEGDAVNLGEIQVALPPVLLAGTVQDESGAPLEGIELTANRDSTPAASARRTSRIVAEETTFHLVTDAQGRYELRGYQEPGSFRLDVNPDNYITSREILTEVGERDRHITLFQGGSIQCSSLETLDAELVVELDLLSRAIPVEGLPADAYSRNRTETTSVKERTVTKRIPSGGSALWTGLTPGSYRATVTSSRFIRPTLVVDDLIVEPGKQLSDERLNGLGPADVADLIQLTLKFPDGDPILEHVQVKSRFGTAEGQLIAPVMIFQAKMGEATELAVPKGCSDGVLEVEGFRRVKLSQIEGKVEVALTPGVPAQFAWPEDFHVPDGADLHIYLGSTTWSPGFNKTDWYQHSRWQLVAPDASGEYFVRLPEAGPYLLRLWDRNHVEDADFKKIRSKMIQVDVADPNDSGNEIQRITIPLPTGG